MSYYDNVKDSVKDNDDTGKPNFETLRKAAQETSEEEDDQKGDGTEIEVLDENGLNKVSSNSQKRSQTSRQNSQPSQAQNHSQTGQPEKQQARKQEQAQRSQARRSQQRNVSQKSSPSDVDLSSLEEKLDTIIDQNERMIEILESFGS